MIWQDIVFMAGGFIFAPSLIFMIRSKQPPPVATSLPTAIVLTVYLACYATMHFWLALFSTALTALAWWLLFYQRQTRDKKE